MSAVASNSKVTLGGSPIVLSSDTFTIAGCAVHDRPVAASVHAGPVDRRPRCKATADGSQPLTTDSVGLCMAADKAPQGPVQIVSPPRRR